MGKEGLPVQKEQHDFQMLEQILKEQPGEGNMKDKLIQFLHNAGVATSLGNTDDDVDMTNRDDLTSKRPFQDNELEAKMPNNAQNAESKNNLNNQSLENLENMNSTQSSKVHEIKNQQ